MSFKMVFHGCLAYTTRRLSELACLHSTEQSQMEQYKKLLDRVLGIPGLLG